MQEGKWSRIPGYDGYIFPAAGLAACVYPRTGDRWCVYVNGNVLRATNTLTDREGREKVFPTLSAAQDEARRLVAQQLRAAVVLVEGQA